MKKILLIFLFVFLLSNISAVCNSNQVDINSASAEELDKIINVGPATAAKIIANRTYNSMDDLLNVKGIGEKTLAEIKEQGLACVDEEENNTIELPKINETKPEEKSETEISYDNPNNIVKETEKIVNLSPISLEAQNIKSENNTESLKRNLSFYGLIALCGIFGALFLLKNRKRKNEFN
jgi:competence ComEA-like helix-hairpin-helix protein